MDILTRGLGGSGGSAELDLEPARPGGGGEQRLWSDEGVSFAFAFSSALLSFLLLSSSLMDVGCEAKGRGGSEGRLEYVDDDDVESSCDARGAGPSCCCCCCCCSLS